MDSLLLLFLDALIPGFLHSLIPGVLDSWIPMEPMPPDASIYYSCYLVSRSGGLFAGPRGLE